MVVDEAHHLQWSEDNPSTEYSRIEALAQDTPGVILLTATPDQLGHESHFARLRLLDPARFYDYPTFVAEEQHYKAIAELAREVLDAPVISTDTATALQQKIAETDLTAELALLQQDGDDAARRQAQQSVIKSVIRQARYRPDFIPQQPRCHCWFSAASTPVAATGITGTI